MSYYLITLAAMTIQAAACTLLFDGFFPQRRRGLRAMLFVELLAVAGTGLLVSVPHNIMPFFSVAVFWLFQRYLRSAPGLLLLLFTIVFYGIACIVDNLVFTGFLALSGWSFVELQSSFAAYCALCILTGTVVLLICIAVRKTRCTSIEQSGNWKWYAIPAMMTGLCVAMASYLMQAFQAAQVPPGLLAVCAVFIAVFDIAAFWLVSGIEQAARLRQNALALHTQVKAQAEGIEALSAAHKAQRRLTHDFRAHLETLDYFLQQKDLRQAQQYVAGLRAEQTQRVLLVNTGHAALDAILNQKAAIAQKYGIDIQFVVNDLSPVRIAAADLTVVAGNLLDNAIEACKTLPAQQRQIHVKAVLQDAFFFAVRNRSGFVQVRGNTVVTTKADTLLHGYGLKNVRATLKKYDAAFGIDYQDGWFSAYVEMQNTAV